MSSKILTGRSLEELHPSQVHPRIAAMQERQALLGEMEAELAKRNAFRPHPPQVHMHNSKHLILDNMLGYIVSHYYEI